MATIEEMKTKLAALEVEITDLKLKISDAELNERNEKLAAIRAAMAAACITAEELLGKSSAAPRTPKREKKEKVKDPNALVIEYHDKNSKVKSWTAGSRGRVPEAIHRS